MVEKLKSLGLKSLWLKRLGLKCPSLKCIGLKFWRLKCLGLKLGVEKSGVRVFDDMTHA